MQISIKLEVLKTASLWKLTKPGPPGMGNVHFRCQFQPQKGCFFEQTNEKLGFYLEVKYPSSLSLENTIAFAERNVYAQIVLDEIEKYSMLTREYINTRMKLNKIYEIQFPISELIRESV